MRMIKIKLIDSEANNKSISNQMETSNKNDTKMQEIQDTKLSRST